MKAKPKNKPLHSGGPVRMFDTKIPVFEYSSRKKAALYLHALRREIPKPAHILREALNEYIENHKLYVPVQEEAIKFLELFADHSDISRVEELLAMFPTE